ncbi:MAG: FAD-dependent oxidoreductase [Sandaracinaceae bacterium]|nr:FAD-dependent oxidoreductase [Sandaracinaceae bacterium]
MTPPFEVAFEVGLDELNDESLIRTRAARAFGLSPEELPFLAIRKRSIDARNKKVRFHVVVSRVFDPALDGDALGQPWPKETKGPLSTIIVGDGPAGLFCAYELARHGIPSLVLERGRMVQPRRHDLKSVQRRGTLNPESNYCFGEGGAGTYSDGKLYTRSHKRGPVREVLETLVLHGAPREILVDARPHIGSNKLPRVISAMRERLESVGVQFRFESRVSELLIEQGKRRIRGVRLADGSEIEAKAVVLATGHSARDVFEFVLKAGLQVVPKPFAIGVRIEHPQPLINQIQYGPSANHPMLPAASYRLACEVEGRGVFSFCMCPGGWIIPASTEPMGLVLNGMSLSKRDSPFANSGIVVAIEPADWERAGFRGPLGGVELQRRLEEAAMQAGGGAFRAPGTRLTDFLAKRGSTTLPPSSYLPGTNPGNIEEVLESVGLGLSQKLRKGLAHFCQTMKGYLTDEALLLAVESRTSAPLRILRDPESLEAIDCEGLYPTGEGAGYAGGIMSAALDGIRVARAIARRVHR